MSTACIFHLLFRNAFALPSGYLEISTVKVAETSHYPKVSTPCAQLRYCQKVTWPHICSKSRFILRHSYHPPFMAGCNLIDNVVGVSLLPLMKRDELEKVHVTFATCMLMWAGSIVGLIISLRSAFVHLRICKLRNSYTDTMCYVMPHNLRAMPAAPNVWYVLGIF